MLKKITSGFCVVASLFFVSVSYALTLDELRPRARQLAERSLDYHKLREAPEVFTYWSPTEYGSFGNTCTALVAMSEHLAPTNQIKSNEYLNLAKTYAGYLLQNKDIDGDGVIGWGVPVETSVKNGSVITIVPAHDEMTLQTANVGTCIAALARNTNEAQYKDILPSIADTVANQYVAINPPGCTDCGYLEYATHDAFNNWSVKNVNMIAADFLMDAFLITQNQLYKTRAQQAGRMEAHEINTLVNYNYFSLFQPVGSGYMRYPEYHILFEMLHADRLGRKISSQATITAGRTSMFFYWYNGCVNATTNQCNMSIGSSHYFFASCGMAHTTNPKPIEKCDEFLTHIGNYGRILPYNVKYLEYLIK
jgi:hypothetical protein